MVETEFVVEKPSTACFARLSANYRPARTGWKKLNPWRLAVWCITHSAAPYIAHRLPRG